MSIDRKPTQAFRTPPKRDPRPYSEKLKDPRWQKKRLEVLNAAGWCCQECAAQDQTLAVHHSWYPLGKEPWEVEGDLLLALCPRHHQERQELEQHIFVGIARRLCLLNLRCLRAVDGDGASSVATVIVQAERAANAAAPYIEATQNGSVSPKQLPLMVDGQHL